MSTEISPLTILTTGGTIEKTYDEEEGTLQNRETIIKNKILQKLRLPYRTVEVKSIMSKDSLFMDDNDRQIICEKIKSVVEIGSPIVVLHGTDTMDQTAAFCHKTFPNPSVPVVFTGAMKPLGFDDSDARQNVVEAIYATLIAEPGYYISFHGKLFKVPAVRKNKSKGTFELIT